MIDNYEVVRNTWRQKFLEMDHESLAERFALRLDGEFLYITYFTHPFAISRRTAEIMRLDRPEEPSSFDLEMNLFNMFHYAKPHPAPSGRMVPFRQVRRASPFESAYQKSILVPFARLFTNRVEALKKGFDGLGAMPLPQGDASGRIEVYPGLCVDVLFWDADDEFDAQANMLFDYNITDYMHEENVVMVASDAARYLAEAAGLSRTEENVGFQ